MKSFRHVRPCGTNDKKCRYFAELHVHPTCSIVWVDYCVHCICQPYKFNHRENNLNHRQIKQLFYNNFIIFERYPSTIDTNRHHLERQKLLNTVVNMDSDYGSDLSDIENECIADILATTSEAESESDSDSSNSSSNFSNHLVMLLALQEKRFELEKQRFEFEKQKVRNAMELHRLKMEQQLEIKKLKLESLARIKQYELELVAKRNAALQ